MKCTQCGSTKFKEKDILTRDGEKIINADAFVCTTCGHIEWFVVGKELEKVSDEKEEKKKNSFGW